MVSGTGRFCAAIPPTYAGLIDSEPERPTKSKVMLWGILVGALVVAGVGIFLPRGAHTAATTAESTTTSWVPAEPTQLKRLKEHPPTTSSTVAPTPTALFDPVNNGWPKEVFTDYFDGSTPGPSWHTSQTGPPVGSGEQQCFRPDNVAEGLGSLVITARRQDAQCPKGETHPFTSGKVTTGGAGVYLPASTYVEVRAKLPRGQGLWPSVRLRHRSGTDLAEVDVMNYSHAQFPDATSQRVRVAGSPASSKTTPLRTTPGAAPGEGDWHTWGVSILPSSSGVRFTFYTDGIEAHSYVDAKPLWIDRAPADGTWDIAISLAVGGKSVGSPDDPPGVLSAAGKCAQGGTYPDACAANGIQTASFPATFDIDYVRVLTR